jgi:hypothetical protein
MSSEIEKLKFYLHDIDPRIRKTFFSYTTFIYNLGALSVFSLFHSSTEVEVTIEALKKNIQDMEEAKVFEELTINGFKMDIQKFSDLAKNENYGEIFKIIKKNLLDFFLIASNYELLDKIYRDAETKAEERLKKQEVVK